MIFAKTTRRREGTSSSKLTGSTRQAQQAHHTNYERIGQFPPKRNPSLESWHTSATHCARTNTAQRRLNDLGIHQRIGVHEKQKSPRACRAPALRVAEICRCSTRRITCAPCCCATVAVESVETSSTATTSFGSPTKSIAVRMAETHRPIQACSLCAGTMNEIISHSTHGVGELIFVG
jgi:hypothetical protein